MTESLAVTMPPPEDVESWAKALGAIGTALAALWVPVSRWRARLRTRREADKELREAVLEVSRRTADVTRWQLIQDYGKPGDRGYVNQGDRARRASVLLEDVERSRKRLWLALGFPDPETPEAMRLTSDEKQALLHLKQTMRLQARALTPDERAAFIAKQQEQELVPVSGMDFPRGDRE